MRLSKTERKKLIESMEGIWKDKIKESGTEYTKNIRKGWKARLKKSVTFINKYSSFMFKK